MTDITTPIVLDGLQDAQAMAFAHPDTFEAPTKDELASIVPGTCWVKVCRADERFWIGVMAVDGDQIKGFVDNDLVNPANMHLRYLQIVLFEKRHCYTVHHVGSRRP